MYIAKHTYLLSQCIYVHIYISVTISAVNDATKYSSLHIVYMYVYVYININNDMHIHGHIYIHVHVFIYKYISIYINTYFQYSHNSCRKWSY
jgi:hypothetical protein